MNTKNIALKIIRPFFIDFININDVSYSTLYLDSDGFKIKCLFNLTLNSKNDNLNSVNILELIKWINISNIFNVVDWDDNKYYDFDDITEIKLVLLCNIEDIFKNYNLKIRDDLVMMITQHFNSDLKIFFDYNLKNNILDIFTNEILK